MDKSDLNRSVSRSFLSDAMRVVRDEQGKLRYFRRDSKDKEEYSYTRPFILELEITRRCNLHCLHCYAEASDRVFEDELSLREIKDLLDQAARIGIEELSLTGGEVFLRDDFFEIIDAGLSRGFNLRFVTNATLLDERILAELCARPIKLITVSLDSISPDVHEMIRGKGSHAPAVSNILRLKQAGFRVSVITAFSRINIEDFDPLLEFVVDNNIDWQVQMTSAKGRCRPGITLTPKGYYQLGVKVAKAFTDDLRINIIPMDDLATCSHFYPLRKLFSTWQKRCTGGLLNIFVRANGDITPCSALAFKECIVGNIRNDSLLDICSEGRCRKNLEWLNKHTRKGACKDCPFGEDCGGGCPEILLSMCADRGENEYCYHRIEQEDILEQVL